MYIAYFQLFIKVLNFCLTHETVVLCNEILGVEDAKTIADYFKTNYTIKDYFYHFKYTYGIDT
jgi:hypothetical protein